MRDKIMFAKILNLDYLNSFDQNQLDLSDNDVTKNINNLNVVMEENKVILKWTDCVDDSWKKGYVVKNENAIPTSVFNGDILTSYTDKDFYSEEGFVDEDIKENVLYCYRVFSEFENNEAYYSGFKNVFYVYVGSYESEGGITGPIMAADVITDPFHRFVADDMIETWNNKSNFDGNYSNLVNAPSLANIALSGDYIDLINKPEFSPVASSGDYNDLLNKPDVLSSENVYTKDEVYSKNEVYAKDEVYTKSETYSNEEVYSKSENYSKEEVDSLLEDVKNSIPDDNSSVAPVASGIVRYVPEGASNGDCYVVATKTGVTFSKSGNSAVLTVPDDVLLLSVQTRFSAEEIATSGNCSITFGNNFNWEDNLCIPVCTLYNDTAPNRVFKLAQALTMEDTPNSIKFVGLTPNTGVLTKMTF